MTKQQQEAIDSLAAQFFENSEDMMAVSWMIRQAIKTRQEFAAQRDEKDNHV